MHNNRPRIKRALVAAVLLQVPALAHAQTGKEGDGNLAESAARTTGSVAAVSEVIVTAQRRSERSLDVPLSITSVSPETLGNQGIRQMIDLTQAVTGLKMDKLGSGIQPAIRGVSTQVTGPGTSANVAMYVDGVYQPLITANDIRFPDIDRIEVLKGPQGSLYGRNATGGAIRLVTLQPSFTATGHLVAAYGSYDDISSEVYLSGPLIGDKLAGSISGYVAHNNGYIKNLLKGGKANESSARQVRGKLLWNITDDVSVQATAFYTRISDPTPYALAALDGNTIGRLLGATPIATKPDTTSVNEDLLSMNKQYGGILTFRADLGFADLTAFSSYTRYRQPFVADGDFSPAPAAAYISTQDKHDNYQQEVTLASHSAGRLQWIVGVNYYYMDSLNYLRVPLGGGADFNVNKRVITRALAVFGEATWSVTDRLFVTAGYRFNTEKATLDQLSGVNVPSDATLPRTGSKTWRSGTPRVSVRYELTPDTNIYASYNQGFKSGVFDNSSLLPIAPEKIDAYEVGLKSRDLSGINLEVAGFYYDYKNQQVTSSISVGGVPAFFGLANAAGSEIYGLDLTASRRILDDLTLRTGLSLLHARFTDYPNAVVNVPTGGGGNETVIRPNLKGNTLIRTPDWTLFVTADYSHEFSPGTVKLSSTIYHSDAIYFDYDNRIKQGSYTTLDARAAFQPIGTKWEVAVYGRNLTDKHYIQSSFSTVLGDGVVYSPPRTMGIEARYSF
jgi:iron complex outermembrane recepter protein